MRRPTLFSTVKVYTFAT